MNNYSNENGTPNNHVNDFESVRSDAHASGAPMDAAAPADHITPIAETTPAQGAQPAQPTDSVQSNQAAAPIVLDGTSVDNCMVQDTRADIAEAHNENVVPNANGMSGMNGINGANDTSAPNANAAWNGAGATNGGGTASNKETANRTDAACGKDADSRGQTAEISYSSAGGYTRTEGWQYIPPKKEKKKRSSHKGLKITALVAACAIVLSATTLGAFTAGNALGKQFAEWNKEYRNSDLPQLLIPNGDTPSDDSEANAADTGNNGNATAPIEEVLNNGLVSSKKLTVNQISEKCRKSSVGIMVEIEQSYFGRIYTSQGVGSGFILSEDGYIATNNHVVEDASRITVVLDDGTEYEATLIGADSITDIAVVKIEADNLPVMELGNSDEVLVGDLAVAIGTPASIELRGTVTDGIISAINRDIDITDDAGRVVKTMTLIQTNATINPGNSGGPLINCYGQVIGINTMKLTDQYEGIGFAIPINGAVGIINQLITDGVVTDRAGSSVTGKPSIGITTTDITEREAEYYGVPVGVLVFQIDKSGSAAKAGLRRGDIIVAFQGETVTTTDEITERKNEYKPGDVVTLTVYRDGEENTLDITFALDIQK